MSWRRFLDDFGLLFFKPKAGIKRIIEEKPSLHKIAYVLFFVGLLRGVLETVWLYLMKGQLHQLIASLGSPEWYFLNSGPFVLGNITSVYFLWAVTAFIIFEGGRFLGGKGEFEDVLRVYGIFMFSYLLIGILNFAHLYIGIPFIRFKASEVFNPEIGIGQDVVFAWLTIISYVAARNVHRLSKTMSALIASLPFSSGIVLYIVSVILFFGVYEMLPFEIGFTSYLLSGILYIVFTSVLAIILIIWGYKHNKVIKTVNDFIHRK